MANALLNDSSTRKDFAQFSTFYNFASLDKLTNILNELAFELEARAFSSMGIRQDVYVAEESMLWREILRNLVEIRVKLELIGSREDSWPKIIGMKEFKEAKVLLNGLLLAVQKIILFQNKMPESGQKVSQNEFMAAIDSFRKSNQLSARTRK